MEVRRERDRDRGRADEDEVHQGLGKYENVVGLAPHVESLLSFGS